MANAIKKVVIFAGGEGTRMSEYTEALPKPLVPINGEPVIVRIMRHFYRAGYREFIVAVGYKSNEFKRYFRDYAFAKSNMTFTKYGSMVEDNPELEDWIVRIVETGESATTGQRLNAVRSYIGDDDFFLTYGDSVSNVDLRAIEETHRASDDIATITAVNRGERFGILGVDGKGGVTRFAEKSSSNAEFINGGFIACSNRLLAEVDNESGDFSHETLTRLADDGKLGYYQHDGFWHAMDTKKDVDELTELHRTSPELF